MRLAWLVVLVCVLATACGPKKPTAAELEAARRAREAAELRARAEAQAFQGCYDCLIEARVAYEKLATGAGRAAHVVRLFEVNLLIALREKELAMNALATIARARALVPELPATVGGERLLRVVEAIPPDASGVPAAADLTFRRSQTQYIAGLDNEVAWLLDPQNVAVERPVRQYLALSLDCAYFRRARLAVQQPQSGQAAVPASERRLVMNEIPKDAPPLLQYRLGFCVSLVKPQFEAVRKDDARWAEAAYFLARIDLARARETGAPAARPLLAEAHARFPASPAVTYLAGNYNQLIGDCKAALGFYNETIAIEPLHDNALLGRTVCLAFLKQFDDSIAAATRMIAIPTSNLSDAYYWRAWVQHILKNLPQARADIEMAKKIVSNNAVHRLAGIIEHDQDDLLPADKDLVTAKAMTDGQYDCVSRWYLGLNDMKRERWTMSAGHFEDAMHCYERAALFAEEALVKMQTMKDIDEAFRARQIEGFQAAIKADRAQQYASAFNAANHYARGLDPVRARPLLDIAAKDPSLESRVNELRRLIGVK